MRSFLRSTANTCLIFAAMAALLVQSNVARAQLRADGEDPSDPEITAEAPDRPKDMPLSLLPEPRSTDFDSPRPAAVQAIDALLNDIVSPDPLVRKQAAELLLRAKTDWVGGIERRVNRLAERADRAQMKQSFETIRGSRNELEATGGSDYLSDTLALPQPEQAAWRDLTQLLALNRMLTAIGSADAARVIVFVYARFGEFIRIDCQRQLDAIGERATAALIEARRHPAPKIAAWAERLLSLRKKLDPHDAVRTGDSTALADILVALGRSRDPELTRLLLSFAASDRAVVQKAAREGLVLMGEVGSWQFKDAYKDITGKSPPRDWTWKRTARELFTEYDRLHLEEAYALLAQGQAALSAKKYGEMIDAYDRILAKVPSFQQQDVLADGYMSAAQALKDEQPEQAQAAAFVAEHLYEDEKKRTQAEALRRLLQAEQLKAQGWLDQTQLKRARELDPSLDVSELSSSSSNQVSRAWGATSRYVLAITAALLALGGAAWIAFSTWFKKS